MEERDAASAEDLTNEELQEFADEIKNTPGGEIGAYNAGVAEEISMSTVEASIDAAGVAAADADADVAGETLLDAILSFFLE